MTITLELGEYEPELRKKANASDYIRNLIKNDKRSIQKRERVFYIQLSMYFILGVSMLMIALSTFIIVLNFMIPYLLIILSIIVFGYVVISFKIFLANRRFA